MKAARPRRPSVRPAARPGKKPVAGPVPGKPRAAAGKKPVAGPKKPRAAAAAKKPRSAAGSRRGNVIIVGFMGTGKTTAGRILAALLSRRFVDLDRVIEERSRMTIRQIFGELGEPWFRRLEKKLLAEFCLKDGQVLAAGGGAVCDPENFAAMEASGPVVCLRASAETIARRLFGTDERPLLAGGGRLAKIEEIMARREPFYRRAAIAVDTDGLAPEEVAAEIIRRLAARGR